MGDDNLHVGEGNGDVFKQHWVGVLQPQPAATAHAAANARVAAVEDGGQLVFVDHFVDWPGHLVGGLEALHRGVELEAFDAVVFHQAARLAAPHLALVRVDAAKRNHDVAVGGGRVGNFFVGDAGPAHLRFGIYREVDEADFLFTVERNRLVHRRAAAGAEVFVCCAVVLLTIVVKRVAARHLQVGVGVDGD